MCHLEPLLQKKNICYVNQSNHYSFAIQPNCIYIPNFSLSRHCLPIKILNHVTFRLEPNICYSTEVQSFTACFSVLKHCLNHLSLLIYGCDGLRSVQPNCRLVKRVGGLPI